MSADRAEIMERINTQLSHVWMVRTFLKHSDEAVEDEELREIPRALYDYCLALGPALNEGDAEQFLKLARKKFRKLRAAATEFAEMQPEVSTHTNFKMAVVSLRAAVDEIGRALDVAQGEPRSGNLASIESSAGEGNGPAGDAT